MNRGLLLSALLFSSLVSAHTAGFHKNDIIKLSHRSIEVLIGLTVDPGERATVLRRGADLNLNGKLDPPELKLLKQKLVRQAIDGLQINLSGLDIHFQEIESKLDAAGRLGITDEGFSVAVLLRVNLSAGISENLELTVKDLSPDRSHVHVEIWQNSAADGGTLPSKYELEPKDSAVLRVGRLKP